MKSEAQIQAECVMWLWNEHPETRGMFFAVTNNSEHIARAMQRKSLGLISGVSDTLFMWKGRTYCFEFKTPIGNQSAAQREWKNKVSNHGFSYDIIRSLDQFKQIIESIL